MSIAQYVNYLYLSGFSKPVSDRQVYRAVRKRRIANVVELGVGSAQRAERVIRLAQAVSPGKKIQYTGIDEFELRPPEAGDGLTLKEAYRRLRATGASIRLTPGDPASALVRKANELTGVDLLLISADQDAESLRRAWFYVPRMLHNNSLVLRERRHPESGERTLETITHAAIRQLIERDPQQRAA